MQLLNKIKQSLRRYVYMTARLHHTSSSKISQGLGKQRSYINSLLGGYSQQHLIDVAPRVAKYIHAPKKDLVNIANGNFKSLHALSSKYIHVFSYHKYNYLWVLCQKEHVSNAKLAKQLHVRYDDICWIQKSAHPQIHTIIDIAKLFRISPVQLGLKFGYQSTVVENAIKNRHIKYNFGKYVRSLRLSKHWNQSYVAHKAHMRQSNVSRIEQSPSSQLKTVLLVTKLFHVPLLTVAHHHPVYHRLELDSPTYKLLKLCLKYNVLPTDISNRIKAPHLTSTLPTKQSRADMLEEKVAQQLIQLYHLPKNYFGATTNSFKRTLDVYKKRTPLNPSDFGYQLQVLRCKHHMTLASLGKRMGVTNSRTQQLVYTKAPSTRVRSQVKSIFHIKRI